MRTQRPWLWVCVGAVLAALSPAHAQLFDRTDAQREVELGRQVAGEVERQMRLSRDMAMKRRVARIGTALLEAMPVRAYPYRFTVLEVGDFNAFCLPGGQMYVFEGLLTRLTDDDSVAFVMAHEITHASHRHWKRMVEKMRGPAILAAIAGAALGSDDVTELAAAMVGAQYSREQEDDADAGGFDLAVAAGFDPRGAVKAAEVMAKLDAGSSVPTYLRSHPPASDRLKRLSARAEATPSVTRTAAAEGPLRKVREAIGVPDTPSLAGSDLWPLAVGTSWTYRVSGSNGRTSYSVKTVGRLSTLIGDVYRLEIRMPGLPPMSRYMAASDVGLWDRGVPGVGEAWAQEWALGLDVGGSLERDGKRWERLDDEDVTTPCGRFAACMHVRRRNGDGTTVEAWFAKGVGLVKRKTEATGVTEMLEAYVHARPEAPLAVKP